MRASLFSDNPTNQSKNINNPNLDCSNYNITPSFITSKTQNNEVKIGLLNIRSIRHKLTLVTEILLENYLDIFFVSETWLHESEKEIVCASLPKCYSFIHVPRSSDPANMGGGVAVIFKNTISNFKILSNFHNNNSFEALACTFYFSNRSINTTVIYRPGHPGTDALFMHEFNEFLSAFSDLGANYFICGDFNYWINNPIDKPQTFKFIEVLNDHNCVNSVTKPTHKAGNILDLIIHEVENTSIKNIVVHPCDYKTSGHSIITFTYDLPIKKRAEPHTIKFRNYKKINLENLKNEVNLQFSSFISDLNPNDLVTNFNNTLSSIHDKHFPIIEKTIQLDESNPWFDSSVAALRKERRKAERVWRRSGTETSRKNYENMRSAVIVKVEERKTEYFTEKIKNCNTDQKKLWNTMNQLIGITQQQYPTKTSSNEFNEFFINKIDDIRKELDSISHSYEYSDTFTNFDSNQLSSNFDRFNHLTEAEVLKLVNSQNKTSCSLDPFNISKVPEILPLLIPIFTKIINACLTFGVFPTPGKVALVRPLLKKPSLEKEELKNYRPVSNLTFLSKLVEKAMLNQLTSHFNNNKCISDFQSAYRQHHSTETALCRIYNDLLLCVTDSKQTILLLLDLSAAFDTIDHNLLLKDLEETGIKGHALLLLESYIKKRFQKVHFNDSTSDNLELLFGVPQGSVLGPVLFSLYSSKLAKIMAAHEVNYHLYADDTQIYMPITDIAADKIKISNIMSDIKLWMHERKLKLNEGKTEVILINGPFNTDAMIPHNNIDFVNNSPPSETVRDLGLVFDSKLSFANHFNSIIKACNYQLRRLSLITKYLDKPSAIALVHAFVTSRVDYCNSLFVNLPKKDLSRLQCILNRAARLIFKLAPFTSTSPYLYELHWLPTKARIEFKICLLVYKALKFDQPTYLKELLIQYIPQSNSVLRSADDPHLLVVPRLNKRPSLGSRAFSYAGPFLYNSLPKSIKDASSTEAFKKLLKTYLFTKSYDSESKSINPEYKT